MFAHLLLPLVVGDRVESAPPRLAPGGGALHVDVIADDEPLLAALIADRPDADAEVIASVAQECRLPVTPYRSRDRACLAVDRRASTDVTARRRRRQPDEVTIVDLTAMWAGPLCTALLAAWGAKVVTVESRARPDGMRGSPRQFRVLDAGKRRVDLDLRRIDGRAAFDELLRGADVLIDSFSSRVLPSWGYDLDGLVRVNARLSSVRIRAFDEDDEGAPERTWVGYGRGVHAVSGLGVHRGRLHPAPFAYPDPLAGFAAFATVLELLAVGAAEHRVVSLAGHDRSARTWTRTTAGRR